MPQDDVQCCKENQLARQKPSCRVLLFAHILRFGEEQKLRYKYTNEGVHLKI